MPNWQLLVVGLLGVLTLPHLAAAEPKHLSVLTWSAYLDPAVVEAFSQRHQVIFDFTYFESDESRDDYLIRTDGAGYDLILTNYYALNLYQQRNWLLPITETAVPNLKQIDPKWLPAAEGAAQYGVPYTWGTIGIAYRTDQIHQPLVSWRDLFQPRPELSGKILMLNHSRDLIGLAAKALGYSLNTADPEQLKAVRQLLLAQKPYVKSYGYLSLNPQSSLVTGEIWAAQIYSGDAIILQKLDPAIAYVAPQEGTTLWVDLWSVAQRSPNQALALAFIDYLNQAEVAAANTRSIAYATPNRGAAALLPKEFLANSIIYPPASQLERSEQTKLLPPRIQRQWNAIFSEVVN